MGREFSLLAQMMSLASFSVVSAGAVTSFSRGVIKEETFSLGSMREIR